MRVLCFHGFKQNAGSFSKRTGALRRLLRGLVDLEYMDGTHLLPPFTALREDGTEVTHDDRRSWWISSEDYSVYYRVRETIEEISAFMRENGPFDGILGFSQGAGLVSVIAAVRERMLQYIADGQHPEQAFDLISPSSSNSMSTPSLDSDSPYDHPFLSLRFVVCACGFLVRDQTLRRGFFDPLFESGRLISIPSLHIIGESDEIILPQWSMMLAERFENPQFLKHPGGHFIPTGKAEVSILVQSILIPSADKELAELLSRRFDNDSKEDRENLDSDAENMSLDEGQATATDVLMAGASSDPIPDTS